MPTVLAADTTFSHQLKFSSYMQVVLDRIPAAQVGQRALDLPAGAGHIGDALRQRGYDVTNADINEDRPDFVFADLNERLPFDDGEFDVVTCLEGIEHVLDPLHLVGELARVAKPGGQIIVSTPNIHSLWSRLQFLFTGTLFMYNPAKVVDAAPGALVDRGHISPCFYDRLRYNANFHGVDVVSVHTDRYKKKPLFLLYPLIGLVGKLWGNKLFFSQETAATEPRNRKMHDHLFGWPLLFGRTMVVEMKKRE